MKTQLLQDIDENGSAAVRLPRPVTAPRPGPAVWRRPAPPRVLADAGAVDVNRARFGAHTAGVAPPASGPMSRPMSGPMSDLLSDPMSGRIAPDAPAASASAFDAPAPDHVPPTGSAPRGAPPGDAPAAAAAPLFASDMPPWLAERLREDAAARGEWRWRGPWMRRLLTSGAAAVLLALVGAGALWLYRESRDEGALLVVANVAPADAGGAAAGASPPAAAAPSLAIEASSSAAGSPPAAGALASSAAGPPSTAPVPGRPSTSTAPGSRPGAVDTRARIAVAVSARKPERTSERSAVRPANRTIEGAAARLVRGAPGTGAGTAAAANGGARPATRRHREETLMQCRVLGYDERTCIRRGCDMTRYGLACKG